MASSVTVRCEQAVYGSFPFWNKGYDVLATSADCRSEWVAEFARICRSLGQPPSDVAPLVSRLLFAQKLPSGPWVIALGSVQGCDDRGRPGAWAFHGLFLSGRDYRKAGASPFPFRTHLHDSFSASTRMDSARLAVDPEPAPDRETPIDPAKIRWLRRGRKLRRLSDRETMESAQNFWRACPIDIRRKRSLTTWAFRPGSDFHWASIAAPIVAESVDSSPEPVWRFQADELEITPASAESSRRVRRTRHRIVGLFVAVLISFIIGRIACSRGPGGGGVKPSAVEPGVSASSESPNTDDLMRRQAPAEVARYVDEQLADWAERLDAVANDENPGAPSPESQSQRIASALRYIGPLATLKKPSGDSQSAEYAIARTYDASIRRLAGFRDWSVRPPGIDAKGRLWALVGLAWCARSEALAELAGRIRTVDDVEAWFVKFRDFVLPPAIPDDLPPTGLERDDPALADYRLHLSRLLRLR